MESLAPAATDGVRLFAATIDNGHDDVASVSLADGSVTPLNVPAEVAGPTLGDISPDGSRLLLRDHLSPESEQPLWAVPTIGGSALRIGNVLAHDATWMPNNGGILYANGNNLYLSVITSGTPSLYATLPGRAYWLRWSPDGKTPSLHHHRPTHPHHLPLATHRLRPHASPAASPTSASPPPSAAVSGQPTAATSSSNPVTAETPTSGACQARRPRIPSASPTARCSSALRSLPALAIASSSSASTPAPSSNTSTQPVNSSPKKAS